MVMKDATPLTLPHPLAHERNTVFKCKQNSIFGPSGLETRNVFKKDKRRRIKKKGKKTQGLVLVHKSYTDDRKRFGQLC